MNLGNCDHAGEPPHFRFPIAGDQQHAREAVAGPEMLDEAAAVGPRDIVELEQRRRPLVDNDDAFQSGRLRRRQVEAAGQAGAACELEIEVIDPGA